MLTSVDIIRLVLTILPVLIGFALPSIKRIRLRIILTILWLLLPIVICGAVFVWIRCFGNPQRDYYGADMLLAMAIFIFTPAVALCTLVGFCVRRAVDWIGGRSRVGSPVAAPSATANVNLPAPE